MSTDNMPPTLSHEKCLELVCAVCTNLNGYKAKQVVSEADAALIKKHVFPGFVRGSNWFPQGMCVRYSLDLRELDKEKGQQENGCEEWTRSVRLKLPDDYLCDIPAQTRATATQTCIYWWCSLTHLNGPAFKT